MVDTRAQLRDPDGLVSAEAAHEKRTKTRSLVVTVGKYTG